ncbi:MAG: hypothetical protein QOE68_3306 [Thermoanaerobaculia bacterium]|nr:hypothetical protein [Thermoanaerobaculia bacterium]
MANSSVNCEDALELGHLLSMLQPIGENAERKRLGTRDCFVAAFSVCKNARKIDNFTDPAAIGFAFNLDGEIIHGRPSYLGTCARNLSSAALNSSGLSSISQ